MTVIHKSTARTAALKLDGRIIGARRVRRFQKRLLVWYQSNGRQFPWRKGPLTTYRIVVLEILLQRTRAETVAAHWNFFFEKFPNWKSIASARITTIENFLRPLGIWRRRAASLHLLAKQVCRLGGRIPSGREKLEALPGIGQYVASAVLLLRNGQPEPLLDTNMSRVLERYFGPRDMADIRYDPYLQALSRRVVNCKNPKHMNWAILDLAALVCKPHKPMCDDCPLSTECLMFAQTRS